MFAQSLRSYNSFIARLQQRIAKRSTSHLKIAVQTSRVKRLWSSEQSLGLELVVVGEYINDTQNNIDR